MFLWSNIVNNNVHENLPFELILNDFKIQSTLS
jgi:hypothetical protein